MFDIRPVITLNFKPFKTNTKNQSWINNYKITHNFLSFQLKELKTTTYNGHTDNKPSPDDAHPIPRESQQILHEPFIVYYSDNFNNLESLKFTSREHTWSANIKKAIASVFQINFGNNLSQNSNVLAINADLTDGITEHAHEEVLM